MSMSGGSLYAATCNETIGQYSASKRAGGRDVRTRHVASHPSNVYVDASVKAANSSSQSPKEATPAIGLRPPKNVVTKPNVRYDTAAAKNTPKNTWPIGFQRRATRTTTPQTTTIRPCAMRTSTVRSDHTCAANVPEKSAMTPDRINPSTRDEKRTRTAVVNSRAVPIKSATRQTRNWASNMAIYSERARSRSLQTAQASRPRTNPNSPVLPPMTGATTTPLATREVRRGAAPRGDAGGVRLRPAPFRGWRAAERRVVRLPHS